MNRSRLVVWICAAALVAGALQAQDSPLWSEEKAPIWGPTFSIMAVQNEQGVRLEWVGHPALNAESRRIDTLDITVKFDGKKAEKYRQEGVSELKGGQLDLDGAWKEIRLSYKTRRPGTVPSKNPRVNCRLDTEKVTLPVAVLFESYKEGPRCRIEELTPPAAAGSQ